MGLYISMGQKQVAMEECPLFGGSLHLSRSPRECFSVLVFLGSTVDLVYPWLSCTCPAVSKMSL